MAPPPSADALKSLESVVKTASTLLKQLQDALSEIHQNPTAAENTPSSIDFDALTVAHDAASLVRAHAIYPSAIITVIRELIAGPIPAVVSAAQACKPELYTAFVRRELAWRSQRVLSELSDLLQKIPRDGKALTGAEKEAFGAGRGSIASTGLLWSSCDNVVRLANLGVGGYFVQKVGEWKETLKDNMEELKEWGDEEEEDADEKVSDEVDYPIQNLRSSHASTQAILDDLMDSQHLIPALDPDRIRPRLDSSLRRLRLVILLFQAITKRRLKNLPKLPPPRDNDGKEANIPQRLDEAVVVLQKLPDRFGDLTEAFYELRPEPIDAAMDQCFFDAFAASELLSLGWEGEKDGFSEWTVKFQTEVKKG